MNLMIIFSFMLLAGTMAYFFMKYLVGRAASLKVLLVATNFSILGLALSLEPWLRAFGYLITFFGLMMAIFATVDFKNDKKSL